MKLFIIFYVCMGVVCFVVLYFTSLGVIQKLGYNIKEYENKIPVLGLIRPCILWPLMVLLSISQLLDIVVLWELKKDDDIDKDERDKIEQEMNKTMEKTLWNYANKTSQKIEK